MSIGITFKRQPLVALGLLAVLVGVLSYQSSGKGTPADKKGLKVAYET